MKPSSFPAFAICGLDEIIGHQGRGVTHVLSILDPEWPDPEAFQAFNPHFRATLRFHDAIEPGPDILLPQREDVEAILTFGRDAAEAGGLLIHCHAGISRSTAATLMILAQAHSHEAEDELAERLLTTRPQAWPNSRMITFADELLERNGRLSAANASIYTRQLERHPELAEIMRRGNRAREVELGMSGKQPGALKRAV
ncbi:MAG: protein-tyrosine-phosphatase [Roseiarcus sp.]